MRQVFLSKQDSPGLSMRWGQGVLQAFRQAVFLQGRIIILLLLPDIAEAQMRDRIRRVELGRSAKLLLGALEVPGSEERGGETFVTYCGIRCDGRQFANVSPPRSSEPGTSRAPRRSRSEEHTSELQSRLHLVCRLLL